MAAAFGTYLYVALKGRAVVSAEKARTVDLSRNDLRSGGAHTGRIEHKMILSAVDDDILATCLAEVGIAGRAFLPLRQLLLKELVDYFLLHYVDVRCCD